MIASHELQQCGSPGELHQMFEHPAARFHLQSQAPGQAAYTYIGINNVVKGGLLRHNKKAYWPVCMMQYTIWRAAVRHRPSTEVRVAGKLPHTVQLASGARSPEHALTSYSSESAPLLQLAAPTSLYHAHGSGTRSNQRRKGAYLVTSSSVLQVLRPCKQSHS